MAKRRTTQASNLPTRITPRIDPAQIVGLADRVQQGDAVQTASIEEFSALLDELKRRGYCLRQRSETEKARAPFAFEVIRLGNSAKI